MLKKFIKFSCLTVLVVLLMLNTNQSSNVAAQNTNASILKQIEKNTASTVKKELIKKETASSLKLKTAMGTMVYYRQNDPRWANYLYGGYNPISTHGCGPTAVAMLVTSFTDSKVTPDKIADWSYEHGYWVKNAGSSHALIPEALKAYGLHVKSLKKPSVSAVKKTLKSGKLLVFLMGKGTFTDSGHFIIITRYASDGKVHIADPNNKSYTEKTWDLKKLISELREPDAVGGPVWVVSK